MMKLSIHRQGGFAGISENVAEKDSTGLSQASAARLYGALDQIKALSKQHQPVGADFIRYELLIEDAGLQERVSFSDDGSDKARQLVQLVETIAAV